MKEVVLQAAESSQQILKQITSAKLQSFTLPYGQSYYLLTGGKVEIRTVYLNADKAEIFQDASGNFYTKSLN